MLSLVVSTPCSFPLNLGSLWVTGMETLFLLAALLLQEKVGAYSRVLASATYRPLI